MAGWGEKYVDETLERAWLALRLRLAERLDDALVMGEMEPLRFTAPDGHSLTVSVEEDEILVDIGDSVATTGNPDEAAYAVYELLHEQWQVIHPVFLDSPAVDVPSIPDHPVGTTVPTLGTATSRQMLQAWVEATLREDVDTALLVAPDGSIAWRTGRLPVIVTVRDRHWIEIWVALATDVDAESGRRLAHRLSRRHPGVNFARRGGILIASRMVDGGPFVPRHLRDALWAHLRLAGELRWVQRAAHGKSGGKGKKRKERGNGSGGSRQPVPPGLMALLPSANRISAAALATEVRDRSGADRKTLKVWREVARAEWLAARPSRHDADPRQVAWRLRSGWMRLRRAIDAVLEEGKRRKAA